jgi:serine phosphatase RsbU (regulator of sigma subunit)
VTPCYLESLCRLIKNDMNSLLLLGAASLKLRPFLDKLGYLTLVESEQDKIIDLLEQRIIDLIVIDEASCPEFADMVEFLKSNTLTSTTPLLVFGSESLPDEDDERVVYLSSSSIGIVASKIAGLLRLRKLDGASLESTIEDMNIALRDYNTKVQKDLTEGRDIQLSTIPQKLPVSPYFDVSYSFSSLEELGGDWFYLQEEEDGSFAIIIADVTGHGLAAAFIGGWLKLALTASIDPSPKARLARMNSLITPLMPDGRFITSSVVQYFPESGRLLQATGGHPHSIIRRSSSNEVVKIKGDGFAIGFMETDTYVEVEDSLNIGDVFVVVSDGITEAMSMNSEMFGTDGLAKLVAACDCSESALAIQEFILAGVNDFTGGRIIKDDITIVVLKRIS